MKKEKYTLVKNPLRTKMSTMSNANASKSLLGAMSGGGVGMTDPTQVLNELKQMQKDKMQARQHNYSNLPAGVGPHHQSTHTDALPSISKKM